MNKNVLSNLLFQGIEQAHLSNKVKKIVLGMFNKNIYFSTEFQYWISQRTNNLTCYSSLQFILLKMTISIPLKWGISTTAVPLLKQPKFSRFGTHFDDMPKILTYRQISPNIFLKKWKQKSVKHRAQREFFKFFIKKDKLEPTNLPRFPSFCFMKATAYK